ncbi:MAG: CRTAC1 family protein [Acidobacteria bacterium]|nr:CRTAC1 family protein [Acidobacteriota bacterium]
MHRHRALRGLACILAALLTSSLLSTTAADKAPESAGVVLTDVTAVSGIDFTQSFGDGKFSNLIEAVGSGVAWLDFDQDGFMDLYLATARYRPGVSEGEPPKGVPRNRLYRNRGNGTFEDVTAKAGVSCETCFAMAVSVADYDNDGWPDIYVANDGPNVLFHNLGNGTFRDETSRAGVGNPGASTAGVWLDLDRDGLLDLYVANYIELDVAYKRYYAPDGFPGPLAYEPQPDALYRNLGGGRFEDVTAKMGVTKRGRAMSATAADYDGDGWDDIYVTNDATENFLWRNREGRGFEEVAAMAGVAFNGMADQTASMSVDFGDYDGDGRPDIYVSDNAYGSLFHNDGGQFTDAAAPSGLARASAQFVGWGAFFFDADNDGDLDLFKVNADLSRLFGQEPQLFENAGGIFRDVSMSAGPFFRKPLMGRAAAFADFDNDGDPDIVLNNLSAPAILLRNDGGNRGHAVTLLLRGTASNRDGIGAKVSVTSGGKTRTAERRSSGGYLSQNDPRLAFGIGSATSAARVEIAWPSGRHQTLTAVPAGKVVVVEEPPR